MRVTIHRRTGRVWPVLSHLIRCIRLIDCSYMGLVPRTAVLVVRCHLVLYAATSLLKACPRWVVVRCHFVLYACARCTSSTWYQRPPECTAIHAYPFTGILVPIHPLAYMQTRLSFAYISTPTAVIYAQPALAIQWLRPPHMLDITPLNPACCHVRVQ